MSLEMAVDTPHSPGTVSPTLTVWRGRGGSFTGGPATAPPPLPHHGRSGLHPGGHPPLIRDGVGHVHRQPALAGHSELRAGYLAARGHVGDGHVGGTGVGALH